MTRLVPLTLRDATNFALDADRVHGICELPDGFVRIFVDADYYDVPGTITGISELLSDPPAGAVRFVAFGGVVVNPALVASVLSFGEKSTAIATHGREAQIYVSAPIADVIAKLEGRAL